MRELSVFLRSRGAGLVLLVLASSMLFAGCAYPQASTPLKAAPKGARLQPAPPENLVHLRFLGAEIPERTRDGRQWSDEAPAAFAQVVVDEDVVYKTPVSSGTLTPTWPDQEGVNQRIPKRARVRVELWATGALSDKPICVKKVPRLRIGELDVLCASGARLSLNVEPARPQLGLGFSYELESDRAVLTRVIRASPAGRLGLEPGDAITRIAGKPVAKMDLATVRGMINANSQRGLTLTVQRRTGKTEDVSLKEGVVYAEVDELGKNE